MAELKKPIEVAVSLSKADYMRGALRWVRKQRSVQISAVYGLLMVAICLGSMIAFERIDTMALVGLGVVGVVVLFVFMLVRMQVTQFQKRFEGVRLLYIWKETGFATQPEQHNGQDPISVVDWSSLFGVEETSQDFFLFSSPTSFHIVPKRCFSSEEQVRVASRWMKVHAKPFPKPGPILRFLPVITMGVALLGLYVILRLSGFAF